MDRWWLYLAKYGPDDGTGDGTDTNDGDGEDNADPEADETDEDEDPPTKEDLDKLKKALEREREAHKRTKQRQKPKADSKVKEPEVRTDWEKVNRANLRAELVSAAIGKLADPKLASRLVDLDDFEIDGDGEAQFDESDIEAAIDDLVEKHPALAVEVDDEGKPRKRKSGPGNRKQDSGDSKPDMDKLLRAAAGY